MEDHDIDDSF